MRQEKLHWSDLLNVFLWHKYSREALVQDDTAYVALLRVQKFVEFALDALERPSTVEVDEEK